MWRPYFAPPALLVAAVPLLALCLFVYGRTFRTRRALSSSMAAMRCFLIVLIMILLMGPSTVPPVTRKSGRARLTMMVDTSASMQTRDLDGSTRYDFALEHWLSDERLSQLSREFDIEILGFDKTVRPLSVASLRRPADEVAVARVSNVVQSVRQAVTTRKGAAGQSALVVLSDGRDTGDESILPVARIAAARSVPVHAVLLGGQHTQRDLSLAVLPMQGYLLANEEGQINVKVVQTGADEETTTLHLECGDQYQMQSITFEGRSAVTITLPIKQERPGTYEYRISIDPMPGEVETNNNEQTLFMEVTAQRMHVLLLEAEPFWDTKFLAQSLRKDDRVELTQITQLSARRQEKIVSRSDSKAVQIPATLEELTSYDVIILGRGIERILSLEVARLLPIYVAKHGGRLVFARGRAYDPQTAKGKRIGDALAVLEPVVWGRGVLRDQKVALTAAGRMHPSFAFTETFNLAMGDLPGLTVMTIIGREKPIARVLAHTQPAGHRSGQPVLVTMKYERGMVTALLGEGLWRWSLMERETGKLGGLFDQFWSNMIRWLVMSDDYQPGEKLSVRLSRRTIRLGNPISIEIASRSGPDPIDAQVTVADPSGKRYALVLHAGDGGRQEAEFVPREAGVHRVVVDWPPLGNKRVDSRFSVYDVDLERLRSAADRRLMRLLAQHSGGLLLNPREPDKLLSLLRRYYAATIVPRQPKYVWDCGWILVLILLWAGTEWLVRKKGGLL